ncbi:MAG: hypothetical protein NEHIOOID_00036 [Holosporales bacterium]
MKHTSICAILASLLLQNTASAASAYRIVHTPAPTLQEFVEGYKNAEVLDSDFLYGMRISGILDLSSLENLCTIGDGFLRGQKTLTGIIFPANLTRIGSDFLANCENLREIDLSASQNVRSIGHNFLWGCTNLRTVILPFNKVLGSVEFPQHVNIFFPDDMHMKTPSAAPYSMRAFSAEPYPTTAPSAAPYTTTAPSAAPYTTTAASMPPKPTTTAPSAAPYAMSAPSAAPYATTAASMPPKPTTTAPSAAPYATTAASMPPKPTTTAPSAAPYSMRAPSAAPCATTVTALTVQEFVERYKSAAVLYPYFLDGYFISGILDLSSFENLCAIGDDFLRGQKALTEIILPAKLTRIGSNVLSGCTNLKDANFFALKNVTHIGPNFLWECTSLKTVTLPFNKVFESIEFPKTVKMIYSDVLILQDGTLKTPHPRVNSPLSLVDEDFNLFCAHLAFQKQSTFRSESTDFYPPIQEYYKSAIYSDFLFIFYFSADVNLSSLKRVEHIGKDVFLRHHEIAKITLPASVISIGDSFLGICMKLTEVDFSHLTKVTHIGKNFLISCNALTKVDCSALKKLSFLGSNFLKACTTLEEFYWHNFTRVKIITSEFLASCKNLRKVNLLGFTQVNRIEDYVMAWCENLIELDLSALRKLTHIGKYFLRGCINLTSLVLSTLKNVTHIGSNFLIKCENLTELDLSAFTKVTGIEPNFLAECRNLRKVNLSGFTQVKSIGASFLADCKNLEKLDLSSLSNLTSIGGYFLGGCENLEELDLSALSNLTGIGDNFLKGCTKLKKVILPPYCMAFNTVQFPPSVTNILGIAVIMKDFTIKTFNPRANDILYFTSETGENVIHTVDIDLEGLGNVENLCSYVLAGFARFRNVDLSHLKKVKKIGDNFLSGCRSIEKLTI